MDAPVVAPTARHAPAPDITLEEVQKRLQHLRYGDHDQEILRRTWQFIQADAAANLEGFHSYVHAFAEAGPFFRNEEQRAHLTKLQQQYVTQLFCDPIDQRYIDNRLRIGQVHHRIGLDLHWYLTACNQLIGSLGLALDGLVEQDPRAYAEAVRAMTKRICLDMGLVMNAYVNADREALTRSAASLRDSQALLSEAHDLAQLARWELMLPDGPLVCCRRASEILHTEPTREQDAYEHLRRWVHPLDRADVDAAFRSTLETGAAYDVRYRVQHPNGTLRMLRERGRAFLENGQPTRVVGTVQDISLQISQLSRIEQLALFDDLTGLPNRANFLGTLERRLAEADANRRPLSLLFIDLDEFKEINDTQGHSAGDEVLVEAARRLKGCLREHEMIARLGGDEFVVLATGVDSLTATTIAARLSETLAQPMSAGASTVTLHASIGISTYPRDGNNSGLLLRNADTAMYAAKRGRHGVETYRPEMSAKLVRRVQLATRLLQAIENDGLELYFQPQVTLNEGKLIGAEALLRWNDPQLGRVHPAEFIPLAEQRGLITELGRWVVRRACLQLQQWDAAGLELPGPLAINISPRQFDDPHFARHLIEQVHQEGVSPGRLDLELTETGIMIDPDGSLKTLQHLRAAGFSLSLDDFGMGYSSLTHLKGFPLDKIKLDRSFVSGMLEQPHDYAIVVATIAMAQSLGLAMVAEGVENRSQAATLERLGCRYAQGFHYGEPLPAASFTARWLCGEEPRQSTGSPAVERSMS